MINDLLQQAEKRMQKSVDTLKVDFSKIRTGRAHSSLLDNVKVPYYGNDTPLGQVANVIVDDPRCLLVTPWEKTLAPAIEKAIRDADLGLNPSSMGSNIRVPVPLLTEERRRDLTRVVKHEAENARVAIRNIRRDSNAQIKEWLKEKDINEDDDKRAHDRIQKLTDKYITEIDKVLALKETELMAV